MLFHFHTMERRTGMIDKAMDNAYNAKNLKNVMIVNNKLK